MHWEGHTLLLGVGRLLVAALSPVDDTQGPQVFHLSAGLHTLLQVLTGNHRLLPYLDSSLDRVIMKVLSHSPQAPRVNTGTSISFKGAIFSPPQNNASI